MFFTKLYVFWSVTVPPELVLESEMLVAAISGVFACLSAIVAGINAYKSKQAQNEHERVLAQLRLEHESKLESVRLDNAKDVDMSNLVLKAQESVSGAFNTQFQQAQIQYQNLLSEFEEFKKESKKDRVRYEEATQRYQEQVHKFRDVVSAIKFNLLLMGSRIDDIFSKIDDADTELVLKVKQLSAVYRTIITSLESVSPVKGAPEGMMIKFEMRKVDDDESDKEHPLSDVDPD